MAYVPLEYIRQYVRPDETEDNAHILSLTNAAEAYLARNGVEPELVDESGYRLTVGAIVLFWYDHRSDPTVTLHGGFDGATRWMINNIKQEAQIASVSNLDSCC